MILEENMPNTGMLKVISININEDERNEQQIAALLFNIIHNLRSSKMTLCNYRNQQRIYAEVHCDIISTSSL